MISCEIISYAFAWRRCGYTAHAFSFSHPSPPVAVAQYSVGWSVFHGAHTAVLGIGVFGTSSSHHPYAQPQRHQGTCATDRWGHLSTTVLEDFNFRNVETGETNMPTQKIIDLFLENTWYGKIGTDSLIYLSENLLTGFSSRRQITSASPISIIWEY